MTDRQQRIREARLRQPLEELERKALKACNRANLWTAEELDLAAARGREMAGALGWLKRLLA